MPPNDLMPFLLQIMEVQADHGSKLARLTEMLESHLDAHEHQEAEQAAGAVAKVSQVNADRSHRWSVATGAVGIAAVAASWGAGAIAIGQAVHDQVRHIYHVVSGLDP